MSYGNPNTVTSNASSTYTYDNNGNLLTDDGFTSTWDYRNRLTQTKLNGGTCTFSRDLIWRRLFFSVLRFLQVQHAQERPCLLARFNSVRSDPRVCAIKANRPAAQ